MGKQNTRSTVCFTTFKTLYRSTSALSAWIVNLNREKCGYSAGCGGPGDSETDNARRVFNMHHDCDSVTVNFPF